MFWLLGTYKIQLCFISKYVEKFMGLGSKEEYNPNTSISEEFLRENGFF